MTLTSGAFAQSERFTLLSDTPVVSTGQFGNWNADFNEPGALLYHDGAFHMFLTGYGGFPTPNGIAYLISEDGLTWEDPVGERIISGEMIEGTQATNAASVLIEPDGTWVLYFGTYDTGSWFPEGNLMRATAQNPTGPWIIDPEPVLTVGGDDEWDGHTVFQADVIRFEDEYRMYYSGNGRGDGHSMAIGLATSPDGVNWTKYDDPATTEAPYAESDPILVPESDWESRTVNRPRVLRNANGDWLMFYVSSIPSTRGIGLARSNDGITWERVSDEPFMLPEVVPTMFVISEFDITQSDDGGIYFAIEVSDNSTVGPSEIYWVRLNEELPY